MVLKTMPMTPDLLAVTHQLASDNEWLWQITVGLRQTDKIIEQGIRCYKESEMLLHRLDSQGNKG